MSEGGREVYYYINLRDRIRENLSSVQTHIFIIITNTVGMESYVSLKLCDLFSASIMRF